VGLKIKFGSVWKEKSKLALNLSKYFSRETEQNYDSIKTSVLRAEHGTWYLLNSNLGVTNTTSRDILPQR
jgi:hypothetical protein